MNLQDNNIPKDLRAQNPWWADAAVFAEDPARRRRDIYAGLWQKVTENDLITAVTGLRRIGKTTILKQLINGLLETGVTRTRIMYFSFEEVSLAKSPNLLEEIITYQIHTYPKEKLYFFFDEIQYVNFWNSTLKKYVDRDTRLKFIVSGSSSLFIRTDAKESLAGRILEVVMRPLSYSEYLRLIKDIMVPYADILHQKSLADFDDVLQNNFFDYLTFGEFPYLAKLGSFDDRKQYVLDWVIGKIVQNDLPRSRRIINSQTLINLAGILIEGSGQLVELQNVASDLAIDRGTLSEYLWLLEQSHVIGMVFNRGMGFRTRSVRQRKIYATSVNAIVFKNTTGTVSESFALKIGQIIETFVYNYLLSRSEELFFWRQRQVKEVDFIAKHAGKLLPVEVKYKHIIKDEDVKNLLYICRKQKLAEAVVVTSRMAEQKKIDGVTVHFVPACYLL